MEIVLPVGPLLVERRIAEATLNPACDTLFIKARLSHVVQILVSCDGTSAKRSIFDRPEEGSGMTGFNLRLHQIPHDEQIQRRTSLRHWMLFHGKRRRFASSSSPCQSPGAGS
jgi:hypothetical protein